MPLRGRALVDNLLSASSAEDRTFLICVSTDLIRDEPIETKEYLVGRLLEYVGLAEELEIAAIVGVIEEFLPEVRDCPDLAEVLQQYLAEFEFALLKIRKKHLQARIDRVARDISLPRGEPLAMLCFA